MKTDTYEMFGSKHRFFKLEMTAEEARLFADDDYGTVSDAKKTVQNALKKQDNLDLVDKLKKEVSE